MDKHSELERKYQAEHVDVEAFKRWCIGLVPTRYKSGGQPDVYYRRDDDVIRHRHQGDGELTVKQRKSATDITDRVEINLHFAPATTGGDVVAFLRATGWKEDLRLSKSFNHLFWFEHGDVVLAVCLYKVTGNGVTNTFIEVEADSGSKAAEEVARSVLDLWCSGVAEEFDLGDPLTLSVYELYTGRRYVTARSL